MMPLYAHATVADVEAWTGRSYANVASVERLLRRASEVVDYHVTTRFETDANGLATDERYRAALRDATCAQVAMMVTEGASDAAADKQRPDLSAAARVELHNAGLL